MRHSCIRTSRSRQALIALLLATISPTANADSTDLKLPTVKLSVTVAHGRGYGNENETRKYDAIAIGALGWNVIYGVTTGASLQGSEIDRKTLWVPFVGPWLNLASRNCGVPGQSSCKHEALNVTGILASGILQPLFLGEFVRGLLLPGGKADLAQSSDRRPCKPGIEVMPGRSPDGTGVGLAVSGPLDL